MIPKDPNAGLDPLALELTHEINMELKKQEAQQNQLLSNMSNWEHQDLAQVKIRVLRGHEDAVKTCQFCFDDKKILSASYDKSIRLWDFETGALIHKYDSGHVQYVSGARMSPCNSRFASCGWDKRLNIWDVETGEILWTGDHHGIVTCCDYSSDGGLIVTGSDLDFKVRVWDARSGKVVKEMKDLHKSTITSCQFSPMNDRIVTTSMDKTTKFFDMKSEQTTLTLEGHINAISDASFSQDERWLATSSWDKTIQLWDISTGMYRSEGPKTLNKGHEGSVSCCSFSSNGMLLVSGSYDQSVVVWDIENYVQKLKLQGHSDWVEDVAFSKDHNWIVTCSKDSTVRLWNIEHSEHIPVVLENKRSIGLKIAKCLKCGKPFSMAQIDDADVVNICVFCRLAKRQEAITYDMINYSEPIPEEQESKAAKDGPNIETF
ncbi:WD repeat-containing protein 88-like [Lineus longissimus]|uniref:WD repeat-containing protein 88-like n=1 Tax=Lineus longissimus TaxID=88925 RepID=UPI002B4EB073